MSRPLRLVLLLALLVLPAGLRAQMFDKTNPQREIELGRQVSREVERQFPLSRNTAYQERVQRIGAALIDTIPDKGYPYQFRVLAVPEFNAFCLPGGFMYVFEGLLTRLPTDDAVAFVMAHEITHARHRHWARIMDKMKPVTIVAILAGMTTGQGDLVNLATELIAAHYSRQDEEDADRTGEEMAWAAGFDAQGGVQATEAMVKLEKGHSVPEYLSDHPASEKRLKTLTAQAAELSKRQRPALPGAAPSIDLPSLAGKLPAGPYVANPWYPLEVGREWTYEVTAGTARSSYTVAVASVLKTPAGLVYRADTRLSKDLTVPCQLLCTADAVWRRNRPAEATSAWLTDCLLNVPDGTSMEREGAAYTLLKPDAVEAPCGTFSDVLHVRKAVSGRTYDLWFARGIGLVKRLCPETGVAEVLSSWKAPRAGTAVPPRPDGVPAK